MSRTKNSVITGQNSNDSALPENDLEALKLLTGQYSKMNSHEVPSKDMMNAQDPRKDTHNQITTSILYGIEKPAQVFLASKEHFQKKYEKAVLLSTITVKNTFGKRFDKAKEKKGFTTFRKGYIQVRSRRGSVKKCENSTVNIYAKN